MSKYDRIKYKIFRKLLIFFNLNTFLCRIMREIILCKKNHTIPFKKSDNLHTEKIDFFEN